MLCILLSLAASVWHCDHTITPSTLIGCKGNWQSRKIAETIWVIKPLLQISVVQAEFVSRPSIHGIHCLLLLLTLTNYSPENTKICFHLLKTGQKSKGILKGPIRYCKSLIFVAMATSTKWCRFQLSSDSWFELITETQTNKWFISLLLGIVAFLG